MKWDRFEPEINKVQAKDGVEVNNAHILKVFFFLFHLFKNSSVLITLLKRIKGQCEKIKFL